MMEKDKPCGARFSGVDQLVLIEAARKAGFRYFEVDTPDLKAIAQQLPAGRVLGGGKLVVPPIKKELYHRLVELLDEDELPPDAALLDMTGPSAHPRPKSWDDIAAGHLVIAQALPVYGWWEAIVIGRTKDVLTLRWRDYPKYPPFQQYVSAVALTPSAAPKASGAGARS
jgi:hypothetical protein